MESNFLVYDHNLTNQPIEYIIKNVDSFICYEHISIYSFTLEMNQMNVFEDFYT